MPANRDAKRFRQATTCRYTRPIHERFIGVIVLNRYFTNLYQRTMRESYATATQAITAALVNGGNVLDCGAYQGRMFDTLKDTANISPSQYFGIEWDKAAVSDAQQRGLQVSCADLNRQIPFGNDMFTCVFGLSLLEHLLHGCRFMKECHRVLQPGGTLVLLTPNISTYFTAALILAGKMPSSGPHPDSDALMSSQQLFQVRSDLSHPDTESDTPVHRHLVVFSYRALQDYLRLIGFTEIQGYGFGLYPFPNMLQPLLERLDPWHCHQMVFVARK